MLLIKNLTKNKINEKFLRRAAEAAMGNIPELRKKPEMEIDLAIVGAKRMKTLNRIWRKKNKPTDVLSFESGVFGKGKEKFILPNAEKKFLGQIIICYPVAVRQAREDRHSLDKEIAILLIHGILHLAGYDHEKSAIKAEKMFGLQRRIEEKIKK